MKFSEAAKLTSGRPNWFYKSAQNRASNRTRIKLRKKYRSN